MLSLLLPSTIRLIATRKGRPMNTNVFRLLLLGSLFSLSACVQQSEVRQMKHSVSTLNQEMTQLNKETVKITQQNRLNAKSSSGVYLLPGAKTPARLESQIGTLRMSLVNITPDTDGTTLTLRIQGESNDPLPAFSGTVEYGQIQGTIDNFQEITVKGYVCGSVRLCTYPRHSTCYAVNVLRGDIVRPATSSPSFCYSAYITWIDSKSLQQG